MVMVTVNTEDYNDLLAERDAAIKRQNELGESLTWLAAEPWYIGITQEDAKEIALGCAEVIKGEEYKPITNRTMLAWPLSARRECMRLQVELSTALDRIRDLEAALEWYANPNRCECLDDDGGWHTPEVFIDAGNRARTALHRDPEGGDHE